MKVLTRAKWLDLWRRTGARAFQRAAAHSAPAEPIGKPVVLCSRDIRTTRLPQVLRLAAGASPRHVPGLPPAGSALGSAIQGTSNSSHAASPAAGLWRAHSAVEPHRYASTEIVAPARFFKPVKRGGASDPRREASAATRTPPAPPIVLPDFLSAHRHDGGAR